MKKKSAFISLFLIFTSLCFKVYGGDRYITFVSPDKGAVLTISTSFGDFTGTDSLTYQVKYKALQFIRVKIEKRGYKTRLYCVYAPFEAMYKVPALLLYRVHKDGERQMFVERMGVSVDPNLMLEKYYNSLDDFEKGHSQNLISNPVKVKNAEEKVCSGLNNILIGLKYIDTTEQKQLVFLDYNWVKIDIDVTGHTLNSITTKGNIEYCVDLTCTWKVTECMTGKALYTRSITSRSNRGNIFLDSLLVDAFKQGLLDFLNDSLTQVSLANGKAIYQKIADGWDSIPISNSNYSTNIQQATKAVVTIKKKHGHASGCLISSDGYIVTNSHVVADTNLFAVLFQNGDTHYAHLVRSNPLYDLALIKVDTVPAKLKPIQIKYDSASSIGSDVYAVGTPEDIELSQTLTRGIISAVRVFQGVNYIQTDVSINAGNSGGALTNTDGALIGIVKAKIVGRGTTGLGFAIPCNYVLSGLKLKLE